MRRSETQTALTPESDRYDLGQSLIGLVLVVLILGGMAAVVLGSQGGSGGTRGSPSTTLAGGLSASPGLAGKDITAAAATACRADYQAVTQAVSYYQTLNGKLPGDMAALQSLFKDPVTSRYFTISIDTHKPGVVDVGTPGLATQAGDANCAHAG